MSFSKDGTTKTFSPQIPDAIPGFTNFGVIELESVGNIRDLGGLPTADGKRIQQGRLLRSGDLHTVSVDDIATLTLKHNLSYICDLRTPLEVRHSPDALDVIQEVEYIHLSALPEDDVAALGMDNITTDVQVGRKFVESPFAVIGSLYSTCLLGKLGKITYAHLLNDLLEREEGATLWHCTQGKDRTGIAAMLIECALGVEPSYRERDYLATNLFMDGWTEKLERFLAKMGMAEKIDLDLEAYVYAHKSYYDIALKAVHDNYDSFDNYLTEALDFGAAKQKRLQELYLEP